MASKEQQCKRSTCSCVNHYWVCACMWILLLGEQAKSTNSRNQNGSFIVESQAVKNLCTLSPSSMRRISFVLSDKPHTTAGLQPEGFIAPSQQIAQFQAHAAGEAPTFPGAKNLHDVVRGTVRHRLVIDSLRWSSKNEGVVGGGTRFLAWYRYHGCCLPMIHPPLSNQ